MFTRVLLVNFGALLEANLSIRWYAVSLVSILRLGTIRLLGKAGVPWPGLLCHPIPGVAWLLDPREDDP